VTAAPSRRFAFFAGNASAFNSKEPEVLLAGAAGTGKTLANLAKVLTVCGKYPGARVLIVRKTRESLTESVLVTWERDVLGPDHPILRKSPTLRRVRQSYDCGNGSVVVVGGMDKPDKVLSSEWDLIYVPEATDLTLIDWETLGGRLRAGIVPWQQLLGDANPTTPTHWLYRRQAGGDKLRMYTSRHRDNPRWFDRATQQWTPDGERYLARLGAMTGARRKRFLEGVWAAAEGLVYDGYDPAVHLKPRGWKPPADWPRVWSIDWGFTNPLVLQFWAIDPDGRMVLYREFYRTRTRVETLAKWVRAEVESGREPVPIAAVCDHDPENRASFEAHGPAGLHLTMADKKDKGEGIEAVQARFDDAGDGKPRVYFVDAAVDGGPDPTLHDAGKPTSTLEELAGYIWNTANPDRPKDEPVKVNDHGCDAIRYSERWISNWQAGRNDPDPYLVDRSQRAGGYDPYA
jgi:hypothetical protein